MEHQDTPTNVETTEPASAPTSDFVNASAVVTHPKPKIINKKALLAVSLIIVGLLIAAVILVGFKVLNKPKDAGSPLFVNSAFDASVYERQLGLTLSDENVTWFAEPKIVSLNKGSLVQKSGSKYTYWLLGENTQNREKYYMAIESADKASKESSLDSIAFNFTSDRLMIKVNSAGETLIFARMSSSLANYELVDTTVKEGYSSEFAEFIDTTPTITIDNTTFITNTAPPSNILLDKGLSLIYRGLTYDGGTIVSGPIDSLETYNGVTNSYKKIATIEQGVLYEYVQKDKNTDELEVKYILVLKNHTKALYQPRNDYNYVNIDEITWEKSGKNTKSYVASSTNDSCKTDRLAINQETLTVSADQLEKIGKYPDGEIVYTTKTSAEYSKKRFETYEKVSKMFRSTQGSKYSDVATYLKSKPFYLIDNYQGSYFVYSDPSVLFGDLVSCKE